MAYLLWHYLAESARTRPDHLAIKSSDGQATYGELEKLSDSVCGFLNARGCNRGSRLALYMPKSWRSVTVMSGASKAGAAYVPIDPNAPPARAAYVLKDCGVSVLATTKLGLKRLAPELAGLEALRTIVVVDGAPEETPEGLDAEIADWDAFTTGPAGSPAAGVQNDPAYLLYTSGSTGSPKGVIISHVNAMAFVDWGAEAIGVTEDDRLSNHAPLHFDLSVFDVYVAFKTGASVIMVPDRVAPCPVPLTEWIRDEKISVWYSVPSALTRLLLHGQLEEIALPDLRAVLYAGEPFPIKYLRPVMAAISAARFFNLYGPTETNVCTYYPLPEVLDESVEAVPIGQACANTEAFPVDADGRVVNVGEEGELVVRGPTVMLGYWGLEERTRAAFMASPKHSAFNDPVYRTGDIVRLEADGNFTFIGRRDHMVKSRGYRIELGDIEHALMEHADVSEAAVIAIADDEIGARLHAAVSPRDGAELSVRDLTTYCRGRLPRYMAPETIEVLAELPKTSTGKTDRVALKTLFTDQAART